MTATRVMQRLDALLPALRERAQETEDLRRIPDESIKALQETGFFRLLQPKQWGGYEADPVLFYSAVKKIAQRVWFHRVGLLDHRGTQLAPRPLLSAGTGRRVGATTLTFASRPLTPRWVWVK